MKKILILLFTVAIIMVGCSNSQQESNNETVSKEESTKVVYCDSCGEESKEVSKYCPSCGEEAKWVSEKPKVEDKSTKEDSENKSSENDESGTNKIVKSRKNEYLQKLRIVKENLSDLDYLYENGVTAELVEGEGKRFGRWDDMLNEIYGVLKYQLSSSEMEKLKKEQYEWIEYRDKTANDISLEEGGGGSMTTVIYNSQLADLTEKRCYELVNNYMK